VNTSEYNFMRPLWRRIAATLVALGWTYMEWSSGNSFWGVIALGFTGYCLWNYFYRFKPDTTPE